MSESGEEGAGARREGYPTSCALLSGVIRGARSRGLAVERLTEGLPFSIDEVEHSLPYIEWDDTCALFERLEELAGGPTALRELGRTLPEHEAVGALAALFRIAVTPHQLYKLAARWYGPANLPSMKTDFRVDDDGRVHLTSVVAPHCRDCPQLFHVSHGALEALPGVIGLRHATVVEEISERRAAFAITPPPSATLVARIRRRLELLRSADWTIDELANQQTLLHESHEELKTSEDRFRRLAENTQDMIAEWNGRGQCLYVSPNVQQILGYTPEHFRKHTWGLVHPDDTEHARALLESRVESGGSGQLVFRLTCANGDHRWFENTSNATTTVAGERRVVTVSRDITRRRELEGQLQQSQKIEALGRLAGGVAHDFNNLLTIIGGAGEALLESHAAESEQREDVEMILEATDRAAALTRQLLTFGRRQPHERRPLALGDVVRGMELMLTRLVPDGVELTIDTEDDLSLVLADVGQIEQVIVNLTTNAIDAMPDGGSLRIELRDVEHTGEPALGSGAKPLVGPYVELRVIDDGEGMDADTLTRIFDPFFTTKETGRGTGLGLATVHGVVEQLGGHLAAQSALGKGTTIAVLLPAAEQALPEPERTLPERQGHEGSERILLVDDEPAGLRLMLRVLKGLGYDVVAAGSADEAVARYRETDDIAMLVTDIAMPRRDGLSLATELREERPDLKLLFISGFAQPSLASPLLRPEQNLLTKPFRAESLARKVREVLDA